jgi:predicted HNH restriction endonuclease
MLSSNENFLLLRANCAENCLPVKHFLGKLMTDIKQSQSFPYSILAKGGSIDVKFVFAELPNDMKMLAFLAGELTNSATYFSTFAEADKESLTKIGTFGHNASDTWKPWKHSDSVKVINAIEKFKKKIKHKNVSVNTKRSNITSFIAKQKSRQEFVPLVAELVD